MNIQYIKIFDRLVNTQRNSNLCKHTSYIHLAQKCSALDSYFCLNRILFCEITKITTSIQEIVLSEKQIQILSQIKLHLIFMTSTIKPHVQIENIISRYFFHNQNFTKNKTQAFSTFWGKRCKNKPEKCLRIFPMLMNRNFFLSA